MTLFEQTIDVSAADVADIVQRHWNIELGSVLRASQNHTFQAKHSDSGVQYAVTVVPDPSNKHFARLTNEVAFVNFVAQFPSAKHICAPVATSSGAFLVREGQLTVLVTCWAEGGPIEFMSYRWIHDKDVVFAWGKWLGELHKVSKKFSEAEPELVSRIQRWDQMNECLLAGVEVHPADKEVMSDPEHYGVIHGDCILSNLFYSEETKGLSVFDWDETQQGWYLLDVAQSSLAVHMVAEGGSLKDGSEVPGVDPTRFLDWMVEGYESVYHRGYVDRERLLRMLEIRRIFYERFCRRALEEGNIPGDVEWFLHYIIRWCDRVRQSREGSTEQR